MFKGEIYDKNEKYDHQNSNKTLIPLPENI